jgi:hypothetical protein
VVAHPAVPFTALPLDIVIVGANRYLFV